MWDRLVTGNLDTWLQLLYWLFPVQYISYLKPLLAESNGYPPSQINKTSQNTFIRLVSFYYWRSNNNLWRIRSKRSRNDILYWNREWCASSQCRNRLPSNRRFIDDEKSRLSQFMFGRVSRKNPNAKNNPADTTFTVRHVQFFEDIEAPQAKLDVADVAPQQAVSKLSGAWSLSLFVIVFVSLFRETFLLWRCDYNIRYDLDNSMPPISRTFLLIVRQWCRTQMWSRLASQFPIVFDDVAGRIINRDIQCLSQLTGWNAWLRLKMVW